MSGYHQPRQRAALGQDVPQRRPSLASPLPPTPFVPSTPLPRANPDVAHYHHHQPTFQQRPSTATSTSSSTLSDSPTTCSTRGMMKRLLAKPAPPSSPSAPFSLPSMKPFHHEDDHKTRTTQDQDPVQEITTSSNDVLVTPRSTNEFDKSIRALDLVGQLDFSMVPCTTTSSDFLAEPSGSVKKQRNVFRRRPGGTAVTTPSVPTSPSSGSPLFFVSYQFTYTFLPEYPCGARFQAVEDSTASSSSPTPTPSITTSITPRHPPFPRRSSLPPTRHLTPKNSSVFNDSRPSQPIATHIKPNKVEQQSSVTSYPVLGDNFGEYCDEKGERRSENGGTGSWSTRTLSGGKWGRNDSNHHQSRPKSSVHEFKGSSSVVDKNKKLPEVPAGDSPTRRLWKLVKKVSVGGLREKNQPDSDPPPPVPLLPSDISNDVFHQHYTQSHSSLIVNGLKKAVSASTLASSPTKPFDNMYKTTLVPSTPPSTSAQHHTKSPSAPHSPPSQHPAGPRPSTTTRSSSPSSDVASSRFFNRQSARSSTSSFGEEAMPLPPLPTNPIPTSTSTSTSTSKINGKINANDTNGSRKLQHHIIPPSELSRNHSTTNINPMTVLMPINPPPSMEEDWTIVRSPSVELEAFSLPPPPRQLLRGVGMSTGLDRRKTTCGQGSKAKGRASDVTPSVLKMVNMSSEQVDEKSHDLSNNECPPGDEKNEIEESTKSEQGDKEKDILEPNTDRDSNRSQSPTIPSFSISSAINSFPARRVSSSLSARSKGSPVALSPDRSNRSSGSVLSTAKVLRSSSRSPQRSGSHTTFGRVRQHLFGTNDVHVKTEEAKESDEVNPLPSSLKSARKHHRYSSGGTTAKSQSTHAVSASSVSMPASPITSSPHRRSISFNTSPALPTQGFFTPSISSPSPLPHAPQASTTPHMTPLPLSPVSPSPTPTMDHRSRSSSNLRSGFSSRKLSEVLFSPSSISRPASPGHKSTAPRTRPSSPSSHRTIGTFISRSISVGPSSRSKSNTPNPVTPPQPRTQLTDQEKADKWNDLLARSARAGGTLHLAAGGRLLGSDDIEHG